MAVIDDFCGFGRCSIFVCKEGNEPRPIREPKGEAYRAGTGDAFSSMIAADTVKGKVLVEVVTHASSLIAKAFRRTVELNIPEADGIRFEKFLKETKGWKMKRKNVRLLCISGIFAALVFVVTAYLHIPTYNGYVHVGDGFIFLAACILPMPYAVCVGATGAMLADVLTGYAIWAPGSVVIKAVTAMLFSCKTKKMVSVRNALMLIPATVICAGGYYLYEVIITGSFGGALAGIPGSLVQSVASTIVFVLVGVTMDKMNLRKKLLEGNNL